MNLRSFEATSSGTNSILYLFDTGLLNVSATYADNCVRNIEVDYTNSTLTANVKVLQGTGVQTIGIDFSNTGHDNSIMQGSYGKAGDEATPFAPTTPATGVRHLTDGTNINGKVRGVVTTSTYEFTTDAGNLDLVTHYTVIGPDADIRSNVDRFAAQALVGENAQTRTVSNLTTDVGNNAGQTTLTLLNATITGPDAGAFSFVGDVTNVAVLKGGVLPENILFAPTAAQTYTATLTFYTDMNAAFGQAGQSFSFTITGNGVPEPASTAMLIGTGGLLLRRRHRRPTR